MIALVGDDGTRLVVWGLGRTEDEARTDAREWLRGPDGEALPDAVEALEAHEISEQQAAVVRAGDVSWPVPVQP